MTCLLEDTTEGKHIHFIDGENSGYALAAKQLKIQLGQFAMQKRGGGMSRRMSSSFRMIKRRGPNARSASESGKRKYLPLWRYVL